MRLYKHVATVVIITPEYSSDRVLRWIEEARTGSWLPETLISASVSPEDRQATPYQEVPDPPRAPEYTEDTYWVARDAWLDALPTPDTFVEDGKA